MKTTTLIILAALALSACESYQPSQANCFSFVSRGPSGGDCDFAPLDGSAYLEEVGS